MPAGTNIPVVIQLGRWRRVYYANIAPCTPNVITDDVACQAGGTCNTRLPRHQHEFNQFDNIPLIAEVTGNADPIECVLPKIGIDATCPGAGCQYSDPGGTGRVQFFKANGATFSGATPADSTLWSSTTTLDGYDLVIFDCEGGENTKSAAALANVQAYANAGGRVFASHFSYVWAFTNDPWGCGGEAAAGNRTATCTTAGHTVADWYAQQTYPTPDPITAVIDDPTMKSWLSQPLINVVAAGGTIQLGQPRHDTTGVVVPNAMGQPATQLFLHADPTQSANNPLDFTWNTPPFAPAAQQCGRVLFSDFHVNTGGIRQEHVPRRVRRRVADDGAGEGPRVHAVRPRRLRADNHAAAPTDVHGEDMRQLPGNVRPATRRLRRSDRQLRHVRVPADVRRRRRSRPMRGMHAQDMRGLARGGMRTAVRWLRRPDRQLRPLLPTVLSSDLLGLRFQHVRATV